MRIILLSIVICVTVLAVSMTDLFRDPATITARNRILNARASQIEIANEYQSQLNGLELNQRKIDQHVQELAILERKEWAAARINLISTVSTVVIYLLATIIVLFVLAHLYRVCFAPSLQTNTLVKQIRRDLQVIAARRSVSPRELLPPKIEILTTSTSKPDDNPDRVQINQYQKQDQLSILSKLRR